MLVVRHLLTIMFTQRISCIGRLHVEKHVSLFVQGYNVIYIIVHDADDNPYIVKTIYPSTYYLDNDFSCSHIGKLQPKKHAYKFKHDTILVYLNRYMGKYCTC